MKCYRPAALSIQLVVSMRGWTCVFSSHTQRGRPVSIVQADRWPQTADSGHKPECICSQAATQPKPIRHWAWKNSWKTKARTNIFTKILAQKQSIGCTIAKLCWGTPGTFGKSSLPRLTVMEDRRFTTPARGRTTGWTTAMRLWPVCRLSVLATCESNLGQLADLSVFPPPAHNKSLRKQYPIPHNFTPQSNLHLFSFASYFILLPSLLYHFHFYRSKQSLYNS